MQTRKHTDWIRDYVATVAPRGEAPERFHFWTAVSVIGGALRRRVYLNMGAFRWNANFYVILVAPPGIVKKSTTINTGMRLLREVPNINFGADCTTWQDFVARVADAKDMFAEGDQPVDLMEQEHTVTCALTLSLSELGTFLNPKDVDLVNILTELWDCKIDTPFVKSTKTQGEDILMNPFVNMIAGTTPAWMSDNFKRQFGGWGLSSRCIFVYCDHVERYVPFPDEVWGSDIETWRAPFIDDLIAMSQLQGPVSLAPAAREFARPFYIEHMRRIEALHTHPHHDPWLAYYLARKFDHLMKLAMVLSVSRGSSLVISEADMTDAVGHCNAIEDELAQIFGTRDLATRAAKLNMDVWNGLRKAIDANGQILERSAFGFTLQYMTYGEAKALLDHLIVAHYLRKDSDPTGTWLSLGENARDLDAQTR